MNGDMFMNGTMEPQLAEMPHRVVRARLRAQYPAFEATVDGLPEDALVCGMLVAPLHFVAWTVDGERTMFGGLN